jgi:hypothetical protein
VTTNAFIGSATAPTERQLMATLGDSAALWKTLVAELKAACEIDSAQWGSSSPKLGWSLRLNRKNRIIMYLAPCKDTFLASFALGQKAVESAKESLNRDVVRLIKLAKRYAEGTAVRIEVRSQADLETVKTLALAKCRN